MMTPRLQDPCPTEARTLVLACAEEGAYDPTWREMLRRHALVVRTHGGGALADVASLVAAALQAHPIERVLVLGHVGCRARGGERIEPASSTAAVAAYCRYAAAVSSVVKRRVRGDLPAEQAGEQLDALVRLANLEACAELHAALRSGTVSAQAAVYDPATRELELFDGTAFRTALPREVRRLIADAGAYTGLLGRDFASAFHAPAHSGAPALGA